MQWHNLWGLYEMIFGLQVLRPRNSLLGAVVRHRQASLIFSLTFQIVLSPESGTEEPGLYSAVIIKSTFVSIPDNCALLAKPVHHLLRKNQEEPGRTSVYLPHGVENA
jgi:hypothetical protein